MRTNATQASARGFAVLLAIMIAFASLFAATQPAWAYFDQGSVEVALGASAVEVEAGGRVEVSVSITPARAEQTLGCGMPKCPQSCSPECMDENGQCRCGGSEYATYTAVARAFSTDPGVAVGVYRDGVLSIYGKAEGEADITVRASLRQYTDGEASVHVVVAGTARPSTATSTEFIALPEQADAYAPLEDREDLVDRTIMGRPIRFVRLGSAADAAAGFNELLGQDADVTYWSGDTYYHPTYSVTLQTKGATAEAPAGFDPTLQVSTEAEGALYQLLEGLDAFAVAEFAQSGPLPAPATVYVFAGGVLRDDDPVALFSYDPSKKAFVREGADAGMVGGYAVFTVQEGKNYVVSARDLENDARAIVTGAASGTQASCCGDEGSATLAVTGGSASDALPPIVYVLIGVVICGAAVAAVVLIRAHVGKRDRC